MQKHLQKLMMILKKYQLKPMMWSDMFFRMGSQTGDYYDLKAEIPEEIIAQIPDIDMVYWDYYHVQEQEYDILLQKHQNLQQKIIFAGGIWTFNGIAPNYGQTFRSSTSALNACKKQNIEEIFVTVWLDDGAETPLATIFPGLLLYAEHTYQEIVTEKELQERFDLYYDMKLDDWLLLTQFDETPGVIKDNLTSSAPSKFLLWQDILLGLYDQNIAPYDIKKHYQQLEQQLQKINIAPIYQPLFEFYQQLAHVLTIKATMGIELTNIYQQQDKILAKQKINALEELMLQIKKLHHLHYQLWFQQNKPFGWEVIDIRYGGLLMRIQTSISRLNQWIEKDVPLGELSVQRLTTLSDQQLKQGNLGRQLYQHIVSASKLSDV